MVGRDGWEGGGCCGEDTSGLSKRVAERVSRTVGVEHSDASVAFSHETPAAS